MKKMWVVYVLSAAVVYAVGSTLNVAGSFKSIDPHQSGTTEFVYRGIYGPEDMDLNEQTGKLYISSSDRWSNQKGINTDDGIWVMDLDSAASPHRMPTRYAGEFHPHGISFLRDDTLQYLFVVNHNPSGNFVERFLIRHDSLIHQRSYSDPMMCCPNDVVGVAPDYFYVTNDHGNAKGFKRTLEDYARLPYSSLLYFDGTQFLTAQEGLRYCNGVNVSADGKKLYLATTTGRDLMTFDRDPTSGMLSLVNTTSMKSGIDNIDVDSDGNLWVAGHPKLFAFVAHAKDSTKKSPSQVFRLIPNPDNSYSVTEVFLDDGSQISGSSVAVHYKNYLYVGGVFQPRILRIKLAQP